MHNLLQSEKFLVIVESPNKVKTILDILKKAGYLKATVAASVGHIMTLENGGPAFNSGIYPKQAFKMNLCVTEDKKKVVSEIVKQAQVAEKIFIMTDGDREGEIIAWSLIKFCELPINKCYRAIVHEITPKAIIEAINNPVSFNENLVNAGLVRMMVDKLIGYGLSPLGKKYIGAKSIGRCQSVGLKMVSDREAEINNFIPEVYFSLYLDFLKDNKVFRARYSGYKNEQIEKFIRQADVDAVVNNCKNTSYVVESIESIKHQESPKPPFSTATFQQEAAIKLGLRVKDAMSCAQKLFEGINIDGEHKGLITYIRTDSTELSQDFIPELQNFVINNYGVQNYVGPRKTKHKKFDQNGHEALRVVDPTLTPEKLAAFVNNSLIIKVYKLIWQRTVASVMPNTVISETLYTINNNDHKFLLSTKKIAKAGHKAVYDFSSNDTTESAEATFNIGEILVQPKLEIVKKFTQPKARYTEASLVKELQHREIGRPSTYASIVETILSPTRGYAKLEEKYIIPTDRGMQLAEYCNRSFPTLINLNYTKELEESLDRIASGKTNWLNFMNAFYENLQEVINETKETGIASDMPEKSCPVCNEPMIVRRSRFGRLFYGCSTYPKCRGIIGID